MRSPANGDVATAVLVMADRLARANVRCAVAMVDGDMVTFRRAARVMARRSLALARLVCALERQADGGGR